MRAHLLCAICAALPISIALSQGAQAQNEITVTRPYPSSNSQGWPAVHADTLRTVGIHYTEPSGIRVGRGSSIPTWVDSSHFQNINVPGLSSRGYYEYYISPDDKVVVFTHGERRVARVFR